MDLPDYSLIAELPDHFPSLCRFQQRWGEHQCALLSDHILLISLEYTSRSWLDQRIWALKALGNYWDIAFQRGSNNLLSHQMHENTCLAESSH